MADNRIAYGLLKSMGVDTTGWTPKQAWEYLKEHGITPENAYQKQYDFDVNDRIKWAERNGIELPLNADGSLDDLKLQELYELKNKKIPQLDRQESESGRIWQIQEYTGLSYEEAEQTYNAIKHYTRAGFRAIRDGRAPKEEKLIEDFIAKHPKYDGKIWRGIALDKKEGEDYIKRLEKQIENGYPIGMEGLSSWSSAESIAEEFADNRAGNRNDWYKIVFELDNQSGVGIDHLSEWQGEEEVLQSGMVRYKVKEISNNNGRFKIKLEEIKNGRK